MKLSELKIKVDKLLEEFGDMPVFIWKNDRYSINEIDAVGSGILSSTEEVLIYCGHEKLFSEFFKGEKLYLTKEQLEKTYNDRVEKIEKGI